MGHRESSETIAYPDETAQERILIDFDRVRQFSTQIAEPLTSEDSAIQSMEDASPTRWHLAHTTWFFDTFLLKPFADYRPFDDRFEYLYNSYYNTVGKQFPRGKRGLISRPGLEETMRYRDHVDQEIARRFDDAPISDQQMSVLRIGINHEQQHQELMLTDLKHALSQNPLDPTYRVAFDDDVVGDDSDQSWIDVEPGVTRIGHEGGVFCFDNELPRHRVFLEPFQISHRCVTNREYLEFMEDGGYCRPEFWLSAGWATVNDNHWQAPLYWMKSDSQWTQFTLSGRKLVDLDEPVCHVSYFEADAFARWAGCRLATEAEWEHVVSRSLSDPLSSHQNGIWSDELIDGQQSVHPKTQSTTDFGTDSSVDHAEVMPLLNAMGNLWEWTSSHYSAYPGYRAPEGALGEYNGKFMCNVFVLKGGSCATPSRHARATYRNFFSPESRWQFTGIRLARS